MRPPGAGAQLLLLALLAKAGIDFADLRTVKPPCPTGPDIAQAIRSQRADCGIATRAVARAAGLDFVPLAWEAFDLVLRQRDYFLPGPQALFGFMRDARSSPSAPPSSAATTWPPAAASATSIEALKSCLEKSRARSHERATGEMAEWLKALQRASRASLRKDASAFIETGMERWPSGLRRSLGKRVYGKPYRGFESLPLRQDRVRSRPPPSARPRQNP